MKKEIKTKSSIYKGVYKSIIGGKYERWIASGSNAGRRFIINAKNERDAAFRYDMKLIEIGKEPVNILKRV